MGHPKAYGTAMASHGGDWVLETRDTPMANAAIIEREARILLYVYPRIIYKDYLDWVLVGRGLMSDAIVDYGGGTIFNPLKDLLKIRDYEGLGKFKDSQGASTTSQCACAPTAPPCAPTPRTVTTTSTALGTEGLGCCSSWSTGKSTAGSMPWRTGTCCQG